MKTTLAILLLSVLNCFAQFGVEQPFFLKIAGTSKSIPESITGLSWWWVGSDIVGNLATNWVDRIRHAPLTNSVSACLYATNGIVYPNTTSTGESGMADGTILITGTNTSVMIIFYVVSHQNTVFFSGVTTAYGWRPQSDGVFYWKDAGFRALTKTPVTWSDMVYTPNGAGYIFYTNGISATTGAGTYTAFVLGDVMSNGTLDNMRLREVLIWTNTTLSSVNVSNLHYYATNTYLFTP